MTATMMMMMMMMMIVITQNIPKVVKGNLKATTKTTFRKKLAFLSREASLKYKFNKARYMKSIL